MRVLIRIILSVINFGCLFVTLFYPSSVTFFALIPVIVVTVVWIFSEYSAKSIKHPFCTGFFMLSCAILATVCAVLGLLTDIIQDSKAPNMYYIQFKPDVAVLGGCSFCYTVVGLVLLVSILIVMIIDVGLYSSCVSDDGGSGSFHQIVLRTAR